MNIINDEKNEIIERTTDGVYYIKKIDCLQVVLPTNQTFYSCTSSISWKSSTNISITTCESLRYIIRANPEGICKITNTDSREVLVGVSSTISRGRVQKGKIPVASHIDIINGELKILVSCDCYVASSSKIKSKFSYLKTDPFTTGGLGVFGLPFLTLTFFQLSIPVGSSGSGSGGSGGGGSGSSSSGGGSGSGSEQYYIQSGGEIMSKVLSQDEEFCIRIDCIVSMSTTVKVSVVPVGWCSVGIFSLPFGSMYKLAGPGEVCFSVSDGSSSGGSGGSDLNSSLQPRRGVANRWRSLLMSLTMTVILLLISGVLFSSLIKFELMFLDGDGDVNGGGILNEL